MSVPWLIISPHCDDGVFACGELLASNPGCVVATVFAGTPSSCEPVTPWDRACGFTHGDDVMASRREEDARALAVLRARPVWLPFLDSQYGSSPSVAEVAVALQALIEREAPGRVVFPLGLFHSDHVLVRDAMLDLATSASMPPPVVYVDALYRRIPNAMDEQRREIARRGYALAPCRMRACAHAAQLKRTAVECYRSQLRGLATPGRLGHLDAYEPEQYFDLKVNATIV
ncbi:MAG: PIG-L deacetylase family protein [Rhodospirillaceae bacterium]